MYSANLARDKATQIEYYAPTFKTLIHLALNSDRVRVLNVGAYVSMFVNLNISISKHLNIIYIHF